MKVEGFNDNRGRPIYQPLVVDQAGREILYLGNLTGNLLNPLTGKVESNGTSIIDVTDVHRPKFLFHIPGPGGPVGDAGAQMVRVCSGDVLPHGEKGKWYLLRAFGNVGRDESHQIWDVTDPAAPKFILTIVSGLSNTHKSWWECDTGIAYLVAGSKTDGWHQSGSLQHIKIYDLSDPRKPAYIRDFGLVGQEPGADIKTAHSCESDPGPNCNEGTKNPPGGVHGPISMGPQVNRIYLPYGVGHDGVIQIVDPAETVDRLRSAHGVTQLRDQSYASRNALPANRLYRHEPGKRGSQLDAGARRADVASAGAFRRRLARKEKPAHY
jgi:hypothetical protein